LDRICGNKQAKLLDFESLTLKLGSSRFWPVYLILSSATRYQMANFWFADDPAKIATLDAARTSQSFLSGGLSVSGNVFVHGVDRLSFRRKSRGNHRRHSAPEAP
jgi:hypothetical protein